MNRLFRTNIVETSGVRTIAGGGTNASNAGQALLNLSGVSITGNQTISGNKTFINNTNFSGILNFNTANTGEVLDGQMNWNADYGTLQIGMNNGDVINPIGFKSFYRVKAAQTIRKGKVVMALGGIGNSEYLLAREAQNIGNSGQLIMGISAEEIAANDYGDVVAFGAIRGIDTNNFPVDSILYYDPATTGGFTNIPPQAPNAKVIVGLNTTSGNNGIVFARVTAGSELGGTDNNVKFSALKNNDFIKYNLASGYWENKQLTTGDVSGISNYYQASNPSGFITSENVLFTTGSQTISGDKTFEADSYIFSGANISIVGASKLSIETGNVVTSGIVKNLGGVSGMQVMTTGQYNAITPISGVVYILI
jgi:hypothetical protein